MSWASIRPIISSSMSDIGGDVAYRTACRIVPFIGVGFSPTRQSRAAATPNLIAVFRALLANKVVLENLTGPNLTSVFAAEQQLSSFTDPFGYVERAVRASLRASRPMPRWEKVEEVRKSTQVAFDCISNNIRDYNRTARNVDYIDIFGLAEADALVLAGGSQTNQPPLD